MQIYMYFTILLTREKNVKRFVFFKRMRYIVYLRGSNTTGRWYRVGWKGQWTRAVIPRERVLSYVYIFHGSTYKMVYSWLLCELCIAIFSLRWLFSSIFLILFCKLIFFYTYMSIWLRVGINCTDVGYIRMLGIKVIAGPSVEQPSKST